MAQKNTNISNNSDDESRKRMSVASLLRWKQFLGQNGRRVQQRKRQRRRGMVIVVLRGILFLSLIWTCLFYIASSYNTSNFELDYHNDYDNHNNNMDINSNMQDISMPLTVANPSVTLPPSQSSLPWKTNIIVTQGNHNDSGNDNSHNMLSSWQQPIQNFNGSIQIMPLLVSSLTTSWIVADDAEKGADKNKIHESNHHRYHRHQNYPMQTPKYHPLRIFVYNRSTWPAKFWVPECILQMQQHSNQSSTSSSFQYFHDEKLSNDNRIADIGLIALFESYPHRVYDPSQADIFVVPYAHASHCMSNRCRPGPYQQNCGGISTSMINELLNEHLPYFSTTLTVRNNNSTATTVESESETSLSISNKDLIDRHLFLLSSSHNLNQKLQTAPLKFVIGSRKYKLDRRSSKYLKRMDPNHTPSRRKNQLGTFIIPYLNPHPWMQPSRITLRSTDWWTSQTRPRQYSFGFVAGGRNVQSKDDPRIYRRRFVRYVNRTLGRKQSRQQQGLGNLPFWIVTNPSSLSPTQTMALYQASTFCPCLPGDTVTQKRFYDVILNGCLPVVLKFPRYHAKRTQQHQQNGTTNYTDDDDHHHHHWPPMDYSWHPFENSLLQDTLAFANPQQFRERNRNFSTISNSSGGNSFWINYSSFVVEVDLPVENLLVVMDQLLRPEFSKELHRRQVAMSQIATRLTYGLGHQNAHQYDDAFAGLLHGLNDYVMNNLK